MRRLRLRNEGGVTLIEMIMVVAILGVVLAGVTTVFIGGSRAELQVNSRFQAQEASRLALAAIRRDTHSACVASVDATKKVLTLSIPIMDRGTNPPTPPDGAAQCGTVNAANISKVIWVVCTSPTVSTKFALYRATAVTCPSAGKLVADNLVNTLTGFAGFFQITRLLTTPAQSVGSLYYGEKQTVDVDIPVSLKQGTSGVPFDLKERLALSNTVWAKSTGQSCSASVPCFPGPCDYTDMATGAVTCFPPVIS